MVALPTPARLATPSTLSAEKPTSASSSRVASRMALCASSLRGRPAPAPLVVWVSEAAAPRFARISRPRLLRYYTFRSDSPAAASGRRSNKGKRRNAGALGPRGRRGRGRLRAGRGLRGDRRARPRQPGGDPRKGLAAGGRQRLWRGRGLRPQQPQDARARDRRFRRGGPTLFRVPLGGLRRSGAP